MKPIAVCDNETDPFKKFRSPQPFLTGFFDGKRVRSFWSDKVIKVKYRRKKIEVRKCIWDCWRAMRRELRGFYIYWHNGGKFDARPFLPLLYADGFVLKPIKGRMARFVHPDGTEFRDSYCLLPVSLKSTGGKKDIDYRKMEPSARDRHREEILEYWKQDLYVLYEKVSEFVANYGFGMTMAGRTFDQLKKEFGIEPPKASEHYDAAMRKYYYGGRCQFFELGHLKGKFKIIDINSAYPNAMLQEHVFGTEYHATEKLPKNEKVLQTCFIRFNGSCSGGLPFRELDGSLSFAPHQGEFFVTGWEFAAVRRAGGIVVDEILECLRPTILKDFSKFVRHFYEKKKNATKGSSEELFAKLFLNSSYGRFALNAREFTDVVMTDYREEPDENENYRNKIKKLVRARHPGIKGKAFAEKCRDYWDGFEGKWTLANDFEDIGVSIWERPCEIRSNGFFNVATAASITGCVRAFLYESMAKCARVVYCDTDSIICADSGTLRLSPNLGEWKLEAESSTDGLYIAGKKLYAIRLARPYWKKGKGERGRWKIASKGVKLSPREIVKVASGEAVKSTLIAPTFSIFTTRSVKGSKSDFITRTIVRDDLRKRRKVA